MKNDKKVIKEAAFLHYKNKKKKAMIGIERTGDKFTLNVFRNTNPAYPKALIHSFSVESIFGIVKHDLEELMNKIKLEGYEEIKREGILTSYILNITEKEIEDWKEKSEVIEG